MLFDNGSRDSDVTIAASPPPHSQRVEINDHDRVLSVTMHMWWAVIVGVDHHVKTILSHDCRHVHRLSEPTHYCTNPFVSSMKAVSRLTSSSRNSVSMKPLSNSRVGSSL